MINKCITKYIKNIKYYKNFAMKHLSHVPYSFKGIPLTACLNSYTREVGNKINSSQYTYSLTCFNDSLLTVYFAYINEIETVTFSM